MRTKTQKADATGRSLAFKADPRQGPGVWTEPWTSIGVELLESYAWRAQSDVCRRVVDRVIFEHASHLGSENGELIVRYEDFVRWGIRKSSVSLGIAEAVALGLVRVVERGRPAYGGFKGRASTYRVTWFATKEGGPPTNEWKRFRSLREARAAGKSARDRVKAQWGKRRPRPRPESVHQALAAE